MLPMRFFRSRGFALANTSSFLMFFGMFGSIFFLAQFFQTVQGYSPLGSGLRVLPWTAMPMPATRAAKVVVCIPQYPRMATTSTIILPASSLTLLVLHAPASRPGDSNCDGSVNFADIDPCVSLLSGVR